MVCDSCPHPLLRRASLRGLSTRVVGWGQASSTARTRSRGPALGWESQGEGHKELQARAEAAVVSGLSSTWRGAPVPAEGATSGKRPGQGAGWGGGGCCGDTGVPGAMTTAWRGASPSPWPGAPAADSRRAVEPRAKWAAGAVGSSSILPLPARRGEDPGLWARACERRTVRGKGGQQPSP